MLTNKIDVYNKKESSFTRLYGNRRNTNTHEELKQIQQQAKIFHSQVHTNTTKLIPTQTQQLQQSTKHSPQLQQAASHKQTQPTTTQQPNQPTTIQMPPTTQPINQHTNIPQQIPTKDLPPQQTATTQQIHTTQQQTPTQHTNTPQQTNTTHAMKKTTSNGIITAIVAVIITGLFTV